MVVPEEERASVSYNKWYEVKEDDEIFKERPERMREMED